MAACVIYITYIAVIGYKLILPQPTRQQYVLLLITVKMLIDGHVIHVDLSDFQRLSSEVNATGVNVNQIGCLFFMRSLIIDERLICRITRS